MSLTRYEIMAASGFTEGEVMMQRFLDALRRDQPIPDDVKQFFAGSFQKIMDGELPKKALRIEKQKGRKTSAEERWPRIAAVVDIMKLNQDDGVSVEEAIHRVAQTRHKSVKTLERYYKRYRLAAQNFMALDRFRSRMLEDPEARERWLKTGRLE